jgi:hypothetical protein
LHFGSPRKSSLLIPKSKIVRTSNEEGLEIARIKTTMKDEKEGFGSSNFTHL